MPSLLRRQLRRFALYLIFVSVLNRNQFGSWRLRRRATASSDLVLSVLWLRGAHDGEGGGGAGLWVNAWIDNFRV